MTDEEKAKNYFEDSKDYYDSREPITDRQLRQIYLDGLTEGRKEVTYMKAEEYEEYLNACRENEELKTQIEKMKCCENCKHYIDSSCELETPIRCKYWHSMIVNATDEWELV